jgi:hypothetical protein
VKSFLLFFIISLTAQAEYRVFTLMIHNEKTNESRQFDSTLDPEQYKTFYPLNANETIVYIDTWRCKGRTSDFKQLCLKPVNPSEENRLPANEN